MMFRDEAQRARVCRTLLRPLRRDDLFAEDGPTDRALDLYEAKGGGLSSGERVMFLVAMSIWLGQQGAPPAFAEVVYRLDHANLAMVADMLAVLAQRSPDECDAWLDEQDQLARLV